MSVTVAPPFSDDDNLFVPSAIHFEIVYLRPSQPAVVPCRVTNPQAKVSLHREVPPGEVTSNDTRVTYDPTRGFLLHSPSRELQGVFYCKAETRGTPQISTKYQLLYVEGGHPPTAGAVPTGSAPTVTVSSVSGSSQRTPLRQPGSVSGVGERGRRRQPDLHSPGGARGGGDLLLDLPWSGNHRAGRTSRH